MPQMSPIFWSLILMSTLMLMHLNSMNFFESMNKPNFKHSEKKKKLN